MQTLEQPELDDAESEKPKISGFDSGSRSILREPTLYLSIFGLFIISALALINTPILFWSVFISLSAISVILHILAERYIFSSKKENEKFVAPNEGIFVATFGSLLPGISLLVYSVFSLLHAQHPNYLSEFGKIFLLLVVPALNYAVYSSIKRKYLARPRMVGMMNGIALGLSAAWTIIWLKTCFLSGAAASCKFGWMFLLCVSPFLLAAAILLQFDLRHKTEARIARITSAFSVIGVFLSLFIVFTPAVHTLVVKLALDDAKKASPTDLGKSLSYIQDIASREDLRPSEYPVSGFGLGAMLVPDRGLEGGTPVDRSLFFKITGAPYHEPGQKTYSASSWKPEEQSIVNTTVCIPLAGLALAKSQINGSVDARTMSSSIDWIFTFHNATSVALEPRAEIALPPGTVVSRATLWLNNQPHDGAVVPTQIPNPTYRTPVLVTMSGTDKILLKGITVPPNGCDRKMRLTFKLALSSTESGCSLKLPQIIESNFGQPKRISVHLVSKDEFVSATSESVTKTKSGYEFNQIVKKLNPDEPPTCVVAIKGDGDAQPFAVPDSRSKEKRFIVQSLEAIRNSGPKRVTVVVDSSELMKPYIPELKAALALIPSKLNPLVYFAKNGSSNGPISGEVMRAAQVDLDPSNFSGGQDNSDVLREALENAAEKNDAAVLWIHGPQPLGKDVEQSSPLDLVHPVRFYDFEVQAGPDVIIKSLGLGNARSSGSCIYKLVNRSASVKDDLSKLIVGWNSTSISSRISRVVTAKIPSCEVISDRALADQVASLWAKNEVSRLTDDGQSKAAEALAVQYHIVTPISEIALAIDAQRIIDPSFAPVQPAQKITYSGTNAILTKSTVEIPTLGGLTDNPPPVQTSQGPGLIGVPVDPRYGQSSEVGQLADYGYDTARDWIRCATALSVLFGIPICFSLIRRRKQKLVSTFGVAKGFALAFAIPTIVHLVGTFMINNYGGLGGGL